MTMVKVTNTDGQVIEVDQDTIVYNDFARSLIESDIPTEGYMVVAIAAAGGLQRTALVPVACWHDMLTSLQAQVDAIESHDSAIEGILADKQNKLTGSASQYVKGDGSLGTLPAAVDISGKSDKANFTVLSTLAAHGRTNAATNSPANSKTDYNVITTLLGTLTDGLNQTNTNQNTIATNLNALAVQFNALLTWLGLSKDSINNLRSAGAA